LVLPDPAPEFADHAVRRFGRWIAARRMPLGGALSVAAHLGVLAAILLARSEAPMAYDLQVMSVTMIDEQPPADPLTPPTPPKPSPATTPRQQSSFRPVDAPLDVEPMPAGDDPTVKAGVEVSDAEIAGAATAGSGASGGACNMPRRLQNALRNDPLVLAAVAGAHNGRPIMVWNGDWVRRSGQEGAGLAAVREAIMWEVGFAPEACRLQSVHGLVLISLSDGPDPARLVVGGGVWRWSDLLFSRRSVGGALTAGL
jgi:hypothetical protein